MIFEHDVTKKILLRGSNYERSYHNLNFIRKNDSFQGCSWFKFNNLQLALGMALKFYTSVVKGLKLKVRKFLGLISMSVEVAGEKNSRNPRDVLGMSRDVFRTHLNICDGGFWRNSKWPKAINIFSKTRYRGCSSRFQS